MKQFEQEGSKGEKCFYKLACVWQQNTGKLIPRDARLWNTNQDEKENNGNIFFSQCEFCTLLYKTAQSTDHKNSDCIEKQFLGQYTRKKYAEYIEHNWFSQ